MRTHSGLHVLCGVVFRDFGALVTGGNMEPLTARMDFNLPEVPPGFSEAVEAACNAEVSADRRIDVRVLPRDEAFALPDIIRTATNLVPPEVKEVRIVDIVGLDQQADGGTHVASTARSAGSRSSRSRARARASAACASASPTSQLRARRAAVRGAAPCAGRPEPAPIGAAARWRSRRSHGREGRGAGSPVRG